MIAITCFLPAKLFFSNNKTELESAAIEQCLASGTMPEYLFINHF
jgi:hypothetical protein